MDILQIQYFLSAAITGNFTAAAMENHISQSSFSKHIMALENELGASLFFRGGRKVRLTPAGERFQEHAHAILSSYKSMTDDMASFSIQFDKCITIYSIPVFVQYDIWKAVSAFRALRPEVQFNIVEGESSIVLNGMRRMDCDFSVLRTDFLDPDLYNMIPINTDRLIAVVPTSHPLAKEERISIRKLEGEKLLFPTEKASLFDICMSVCKKAGFTPDIPYTVSGKPEVSLNFVQQDRVICLTMEKVFSYLHFPGCKIVQLEEEYYSTTALVSLKSRELSNICKKFMSFFKDWQKD